VLSAPGRRDVGSDLGSAAAANLPSASPSADEGSLSLEVAAMLAFGGDHLANQGKDGGGGGLHGGGEARAMEVAAVAVPLDLIEGHNSKGNTRILLKTECYPSGAIRAVLKEIDTSASPVIEAGARSRLRSEDRSEWERVDSSIQRTRKTIRQRCMAFKCDRLLTLTYRENMTDRERCQLDTATFIRKAQSAGLLPKYVAVPELQKRGAYHVHLAIRGYMPVVTLRRIWRSVVGQDNGNVDISYQRRGSLNPWRIASYLSKYIGKAVAQSQPGERTFWASEWHGLDPRCRALLLSPGVTLTQVEAAVAARLIQLRQQGSISDWEHWRPKPPRDGPADQPVPTVIWAA
jgi:hypothetical protein